MSPRKLRDRKPKRDIISPMKLRNSKASGRKQRQRKRRPNSKTALKRNCHSHHHKHPIDLKCLECGLSFCARALEGKFPYLQDTETGSWSCPRCSGACKCAMCVRKRKKMDCSDLLLRVNELINERDQEKARVASCLTTIEEYEKSYSGLQALCHRLKDERDWYKMEYEKLKGELWEELRAIKKRQETDNSLKGLAETQMTVIRELQSKLANQRSTVLVLRRKMEKMEQEMRPPWKP